MIIVGIKRAGSNEVLTEVALPQTLYELPLNRYIDFAVTLRGYEQEFANVPEIMGTAVSYFCGKDIDTLFQAEMYGEATEDMKMQTVSSLYAYASKLVGAHKPRIRQRGEKVRVGEDDYILPALTVDAVIGLEGRLSMLEAIEAHEVRRKVRDKIEIDGDPEGQLWFSEYVRLLTVLFRKEGFMLPLDDDQRKQYFETEAVKLARIDAGTALDVDFFLTRSFLEWNKTTTCVGSLTLSAMRISREVKPVSRKVRRLLAQNKAPKMRSKGSA